ncbi:hypothetical protein L195_g019243 [Trifolium pratense]|uniref:Uncharacterized protein n=1 Tax=Trifolium pratense TaxID=57577 RepID=A0A2K3MZ41_TRIPR|nr:hypothetical protein L195_g019243 [Trifolium pratense]
MISSTGKNDRHPGDEKYIRYEGKAISTAKRAATGSPKADKTEEAKVKVIGAIWDRSVQFVDFE